MRTITFTSHIGKYFLKVEIRRLYHYLNMRKWEENMAKNTGNNFRKGAVTDRSQTHNPKTDQYVKRDADSGKFMDVKQDGKPFKGVRKEK